MGARMSLFLNQSKARTVFKKLLGNANHLIITALVGLDAVEKGIVSGIPADMHAVWSPIQQDFVLNDLFEQAREEFKELFTETFLEEFDVDTGYGFQTIWEEVELEGDVVISWLR